MNYLRILGDGLVLTGVLLGTGLINRVEDEKKRNLKSSLIYMLGLIFSIIEVYFIYRHQENSDLFFWHPYLAWTFGNIIFIVVNRKYYSLKRIIMERVVLWQVIVNTVFAGLTLAVGWLMKLYIR